MQLPIPMWAGATQLASLPTHMKSRTLLCALLMVALQDFTLGGQPILGFAAGCEPAMLVEFEGAAPDLIFKIDRHDILARLGFYERRTSCSLA